MLLPHRLIDFLESIVSMLEANHCRFHIGQYNLLLFDIYYYCYYVTLTNILHLFIYTSETFLEKVPFIQLSRTIRATVTVIFLLWPLTIPVYSFIGIGSIHINDFFLCSSEKYMIFCILTHRLI